MPAPKVYTFEISSRGKATIVMEKIEGEQTSYLLNNEKTAHQLAKKMAQLLWQLHNLNLGRQAAENLEILKLEFTKIEEEQLEYIDLVKKTGIVVPGFGERRQERIGKALKRLQVSKPGKSKSVIIHRELEPNHILLSKGRFVIVDWGDALVGDPACDVATTYHLLRLSLRLQNLKINDVSLAK